MVPAPMSSATPLVRKNRSASWCIRRLRRCRNVHARLPTQATMVATEAEMTLAVVGLSSSTVARSRFMTPTSTTKATAPTTPNLIASR